MARAMKDSGIEWVGAIPENWDIYRLKSCISSRDAGAWGEEATGNENDYICIRIADFDYSRMTIKKDAGYEYTKRNYKPETVERLLLKKNDILIEKSGGGEKTPVGRTIIFDEDFPALYANFSERLRVKEFVLPKFMQYVFVTFYKNRYSINYIKQTTGIQNLDITAMLSEEKIPIPSIDEQVKVVAFLDDKIGEVDTIISKTKKSIEDYQKYKQAVITEAIIQGLDKTVAVVNTDNIHIPKIPAHWEMKKMKYIFEIKKDIAGKEGYDILSITQKGIKIKDISKNEGQLAQNYLNYQLVDTGDFAMNHMDLLTGWVDISKYAGVTSPDYRVFRFIDATDYDADYYLYLMQMCYMNRIFYGLGQGVSNLGRWRLQADKFLNFTIPVPPLKEQQEIAKHLSVRCTEIDALIAKKEAFVEEMETYKKSLIYEYVTGKKEVL